MWTDAIADFVRLRTEVHQAEILKELGIHLKDADARHAARIGRVMKKLGWDMGRDRRGGDDRVRFTRDNLMGAAEDREGGNW